eukprot:3202262-Pyramimonas_sp.AAC.1
MLLLLHNGRRVGRRRGMFGTKINGRFKKGVRHGWSPVVALRVQSLLSRARFVMQASAAMSIMWRLLLIPDTGMLRDHATKAQA